MDQLTNFKRTHDHGGAGRLNLPTFQNSFPPAFVVSAILEVLADSRYAERTWIVAGEADSYCAAAAMKASASNPDKYVDIFTCDSDLIVYNAGFHTRIVMIKEIRERHDESDIGGTFLGGSLFRPGYLREKYAIAEPDLVRPAWEMHSEPRKPFHQAVKRAHGNEEIDTDDYLAFKDTFDVSAPSARLELQKADRQRGKAFQQVDPRTSELINAAKTLMDVKNSRDSPTYLASVNNGNESSDDVTDADDPELDMYLPMLFEDPSRSAAWIVGEDVRMIARSLLLHMCGLKSKIFEYRKSGSTIRRVPTVNFRTLEELRSFVTSMTDLLRDRFYQETNLKWVNSWKFLVMHYTLIDIAPKGALPDTNSVTEVLNGAHPTDWQVVHLSAQYEAQYYSMRMLKQVVEFLQAEGVSLGWTEELGRHMDSLPSICQFFEPGGEWEAFVEPYMRRFDVDAEEIG